MHPTSNTTRPLPLLGTPARSRLCAALLAALCAVPLAMAQTSDPGPAAGGETTRAQALQNAAGIAQRAASALEAAKPPPWFTTERSFMQSARANSAFEVEAGRIGLRRATDPAVKNLAQMLANDHAVAVRELDHMAKSRGAQLDGKIDAAQQRMLARLRSVTGFDTEFVRSVGVQAHQEDIAMYQQAQGRTSDPELKGWIDAKLIGLREHLSTAQKIPLRNAPDRTPNSGRNEATPATLPGGAQP